MMTANELQNEFAITAIIPVYNGAKFVDRAIRSAQTQTTSVTEILVIDDCSTDQTVSVVESIARDDSRVRLLRNERNSGPAHSRNYALKQTQTPIAAFLDADDLWLPEHAGHLARAFGAFPSASVAYTDDVLDVHLQGTIPGNGAIEIFHNPVPVFLDENPIAQSAAAVRVADILRIGAYSEGARYAEDYGLWMRMALANMVFVRVASASVVRTGHEGQVSFTHAHEMIKNAWKIRRAAVEQYYGSIANAHPDAVAGMLRSQGRGFSAAFNARRRDLIQLTIAQTSWIPARTARLKSAQRTIGWQWPFWRSATFIYDSLPASMKDWWRASRRNRNIVKPSA